MKKSMLVLSCAVVFSLVALGQTPESGSASTRNDSPQTIEGQRTYFMFVQTAGSGTYSPVDKKEGRYTVELTNVSPTTIYFSDRPERIAGHVPMQKFLDGLGFSDENPPNASIEVETGEGETDVVVVELRDPKWDEKTKTLSYEIAMLEDASDGGLAHFNDRKSNALPAEFGSAAVFIDDCADATVYCYAPGALNPPDCEPWTHCDPLFGGGSDNDGSERCRVPTLCGSLPGKAGMCWNGSTFACRLCRGYQSECLDMVSTDCRGSVFVGEANCPIFSSQSDGTDIGKVKE